MAEVFISYRRQDSAAVAGRLADRLKAHCGAARVFQDVGDIAPGADFVATLERCLATAGVVLVLIGRGWLAARDADGRRRLDDPQDFVRREIEAALAAGTPLLPLLLDGATMPAAEQLPASLQPLARRQALRLEQLSWDADFAALCQALARHGVQPGLAGGGAAAPGWHWAARQLVDLLDLLVHPRGLIARRLGSAVDAGADRSLVEAALLLAACLLLGNLLLGVALERPLAGWLAAGLLINLALAAALAAVLALAWRLVLRRPAWRRVAPVAWPLYGGAFVYFCLGALVVVLGVQWVQPDLFERLTVLGRQGSAALPQILVLLEGATRGAALAAALVGVVVWAAGAVWLVRGWSMFRFTLDAGRGAGMAATGLAFGLLAGLAWLAGWVAG